MKSVGHIVGIGKIVIFLTGYLWEIMLNIKYSCIFLDLLVYNN